MFECQIYDPAQTRSFHYILFFSHDRCMCQIATKKKWIDFVYAFAFMFYYFFNKTEFSSVRYEFETGPVPFVMQSHPFSFNFDEESDLLTSAFTMTTQLGENIIRF